MKIGVIGDSGYIGSNLLKSLSKRNYNLSGYNSYIERECSFLESKYMPHSMTSFMSTVDVVINTTGKFKPNDFTKNPDAKISNGESHIKRLVDSFNASNAKKLIHISSGGAIYGECKTTYGKEDEDVCPITPYGIMKLKEEKVIKENLLAYKNALVFRLTNPFGNSTNAKHGLIDAISRSYLDSAELRLTEDIDCCRDFIHIEDAIEFIVRAIDRNYFSRNFDICNLGSGISYNIHELVASVISTYPDLKVLYDIPRRSTDISESRVSMNKTFNVFGRHEFVDPVSYILQSIKNERF